MADFHGLGFTHKDLKPHNIFYIKDKTSMDKMKILLIDYAFTSNKFHDKDFMGTPFYMSNEFNDPDKNFWYNETIDVHAIGISILDMIEHHVFNYAPIDYGLLTIIESMISDNKCVNLKKNGVFCRNKELYWDENFVDLEEIKDFVDNKNKKTC